MTLPYPNITNDFGIFNLMIYANTITNNLFWPLIILSLFVITFITVLPYKTERAWAVSSFMAFVSCSLLISIGLINFGWWLGSLINAGASIIALKVSGSKDI